MRKLPILVLLLFCVQIASAQKMNDDQVIEYVMAAQEKGDSQQQIAKDLLRRGVTMDQVNRIKRKMESQKTSGIGASMTEKKRTRTAPRRMVLLSCRVTRRVRASSMLRNARE